MASRRGRTGDTTGNRFGGDWTDEKLAVLASYLGAYQTALKKSPFTKGYIDAFAGTGYRESRSDDDSGESRQIPLLPDLAAEEPQRFRDGSARIALLTEPPFDRYIFIERSAKRCAALERLKAEFPDRAERVDIVRGDANDVIQKLCKRDWRSHRAVLFLDPYGMEVEWKTIEAVASTRAIDLWLLFPLGIGVNRLLTRSAEIPAAWRRRLDLFLGTTGWYDALYTVETMPSLLGEEERVVKAKMETIGRYFLERLRGVFAGVAAEPGVLRNSVNNPLYLLCFATGNPRGSEIALRIAGHLLRGMR